MLFNVIRYWLILADETTDVSLKEQLTLCVWYVKDNGESAEIHESFLKYIEIHSLTGKNLATVILESTSYEKHLLACSIMYN